MARLRSHLASAAAVAVRRLFHVGGTCNTDVGRPAGALSREIAECVQLTYITVVTGVSVDISERSPSASLLLSLQC